MSSNPNSSDFSYKKYSLEQLDNWVHDALNCEDLTPQDIYETIVICVDESVEYHKKYLTKSIELLSLLKGHRPINFDTTQNDWNDFWEENDCLEEHKQYTEEELNAMCDAAEEKEKCREYNLREAEYYDKRAQLDGKFTCKSSKDKKEVYTSNLSTSSDKKVKIDTTYGTVSDYQPKTYDGMIADGYSVNGVEHSKYYYDYDRNDPNRTNTFTNSNIQLY